MKKLSKYFLRIVTLPVILLYETIKTIIFYLKYGEEYRKYRTRAEGLYNTEMENRKDV